jgi:hypothetical protein
MKKRRRILPGAALLAIFTLAAPALAQTHGDLATNAPADAAPTVPAGPVIMPPAAEAPPAPSTASSPVPPPNAASLTPQISSPGATPKEEEIDDIRPPLFYLRSWLWLWITLGVLALAGLFVLLWKWLSQRTGFNPKTAYDLALEKLEKARELMREDDPAPYAIAVSETIRTYLGQRFQAPSSRLTTEEFLRRMQDDSATPLAEHRELLGDFLRACDLVKFARYQPTQAELEEVQQSAVAFVQATKPGASVEPSPARLAPAAAHS